MNAYRKFLAALVAAVALAAPAHAQTPFWPSKTVRIVVPYPPGMGTDILARLLAQRFSAQWGQSVVVDNRPGANTLLGAEAVARSAPDGHTLMITTDATFVINPHLYVKLPYDAIKSFAPISLLATFTMVMVAQPSFAANDVAELVAIAKSRPGQITYGSFGPGSQHHLLFEMLNQTAGIKLVQVPYKGVPQIMAAVLSGEIQLALAGAFSAKGHIAARRLKALGVSGPKRSPFVPDVPSLIEQGFPAVEYTLWLGLFAPAGTPRSVIDRINANVTEFLSDPAVRDKELLALGYEPSGLGPDEFAARIRRELAALANIVKISGARAD